MMISRRHVFAAALGLWALAGCTSGAQDSCSPSLPIDTCDKGYYCTQVGVCTRRCQNASECRVSCTQSGGPDCAMYEDCQGGICASTLESVCVNGLCQQPCAATDGGCDYDPYGPRDPQGTGGQP